MRICEKNIEGFAKYTAAAACLNELRMEVQKIVEELTTGISDIGKKSHFLKWDFFPIESILVYGYSIMIVLNVLACFFGSDAINKKKFFEYEKQIEMLYFLLLMLTFKGPMKS